MANEIFEPEQAWRFCNICDPQNTRPFSAERAYIKHQTSQGHLKRTGQPLQDVVCPKCGKSLSRGSIVLRHVASGQCPGRRSTPNAVSEPSRKHALSVSPNGIVRKIQKSAAFDFKDGGTSPDTSTARSTAAIVTNSAGHIDKQLMAQGSEDNACWSSYKPISPHSRSNSRPFGNQARTDNIAVPSSHSMKVSNASTIHHDNARGIPATSPTNLLLTALVEVSPDRQTLGSDSIDRNQEDRIDDVDDAKNDSDVNNEKPRLYSPHSDDTLTTSTATLDEGKETDQWLSAAMESASLENDNLAYSKVQGLLSSTTVTPATNIGSWGSLFLKRSPRIAMGFGWSLSPLPRVSPRTWSSVRSVEMPTPMLTGPVDEELRASRSTKDQPASAPVHIEESGNRNEHVMDVISPSTHNSPGHNFIDGIDIDVNYRSKSRDNRTALMLAVVQRQQNVIYTLLKTAIVRGRWPNLSISDDNGDTILTLAKNAGFSHELNQLLRLFVAVACCQCTESTRSGSVCGKLARRGGYLEGDELKKADPECWWGEQLRRPDWPRCEWNLEWIIKQLRWRTQGLPRYDEIEFHPRCLWLQNLRLMDWPGREWSLDELLKEKCLSESCTRSHRAALRLLRPRFALAEIDHRARNPRFIFADTLRAQRQRMLSEWINCEVLFS